MDVGQDLHELHVDRLEGGSFGGHVTCTNRAWRNAEDRTMVCCVLGNRIAPLLDVHGAPEVLEVRDHALTTFGDVAHVDFSTLWAPLYGSNLPPLEMMFSMIMIMRWAGTLLQPIPAMLTS